MENVESTLTRKTFSHTPREYEPSKDYVRVAAATPEVGIADIPTNVDRIAELYETAAQEKTSLVVFPELSITGYTIGDLVQSPGLLEEAQEGLAALSELTAQHNSAMVVGLPFAVNNAIYNTAAFLADGEVKGIVPKQNLPTYKEFYEKRWYQAWGDQPNQTVHVDGQPVPFGRDQLFKVGDSTVGVEICEDLWVANAPNTRLAANGADIIVNPSASPEIASKREYRRNLVAVTAGKLACGYVYAGAHPSESTMDIVMSGHAMASEGGRLLAERAPFVLGQPLTYADIDRAHLMIDRRRDTNYPNHFDITPTQTNVTPEQTDLRRDINPAPFIPHGSPEQISERLDEILTIQSVALAQRILKSGMKKVVLGLSGGLDSTLALLVAERAAEYLNVPAGELIETLTMPSHASSDRTQSNAVKLAQSRDIPNTEIPIAELSEGQLAAIDHGGLEDTTFENTQARIRTALLMNYANKTHGLVLGTGDLSEIALGWCTFNGDHMSHYNVNASIPKTLVRHLVNHAAQAQSPERHAILKDILDTPVSPELTGDGTLSQETESIIGPYELHDFFLYHFVRFMEPSSKISYLAKKAFEGAYEQEEIDKWLGIFIKRFNQSQWKRSVMPDGPKVGTVSLSPRGDWRMPSDAAEAARRDLSNIGVDLTR